MYINILSFIINIRITYEQAYGMKAQKMEPNSRM